MQEELITFETARLAKEKGFNSIKCVSYTLEGDICDKPCYNLEGDGKYLISAPSQSLLQRWLREKHNILVEPSWEGTHEIYSINYRIIILGNTIYKDFRGCFDGQSYEQALEVGLQEALKLIKL